jgi:hypothetical protein
MSIEERANHLHRESTHGTLEVAGRGVALGMTRACTDLTSGGAVLGSRGPMEADALGASGGAATARLTSTDDASTTGAAADAVRGAMGATGALARPCNQATSKSAGTVSNHARRLAREALGRGGDMAIALAPS